MGATGAGAVLLSLCVAGAVLAISAAMLFVSTFLERLDRPPAPAERPTRERGPVPWVP